MTQAERDDVKALIRFYEKRGWDWSLAVEFHIRRYNGTWPEQRRWPYVRGKRNAKPESKRTR